MDNSKVLINWWPNKILFPQNWADMAAIILCPWKRQKSRSPHRLASPMPESRWMSEITFKIVSMLTVIAGCRDAPNRFLRDPLSRRSWKIDHIWQFLLSGDVASVSEIAATTHLEIFLASVSQDFSQRIASRTLTAFMHHHLSSYRNQHGSKIMYPRVDRKKFVGTLIT